MKKIYCDFCGKPVKEVESGAWWKIIISHVGGRFSDETRDLCSKCLGDVSLTISDLYLLFSTINETEDQKHFLVTSMMKSLNSVLNKFGLFVSTKIVKKCPVCGGSFGSNDKHKVYCSRKCQISKTEK